MRVTGFALIVFGALLFLVALVTDTSVATGAGTRVNNIGLLAQQSMFIMLGGFLLIAGVILIVAGRHRKDVNTGGSVGELQTGERVDRQMVRPLSLSTAWDETKAVIAHDGRLILAVALALIVLPQAIVGLLDPPMGATSEPSNMARLVALLAILVQIVGQLALIRLALGPPVSVGEAIAHGGRRFLPALGALILFGIGFALALTPLIILLVVTGAVEMPEPGAQPPGGFVALVFVMVLVILAIGPRIMLMMPVASAEETGPVALLRRSWSISGGHYWRLLAFLILILVVALVLLITAQLIGGVLAGVAAGKVEPMSLSALIVALLISIAQGAFTILSSVMLARIYVQLAGGGAESSVPNSGM